MMRKYEKSDLAGVRYLWITSLLETSIRDQGSTSDIWAEYAPIVARLAAHSHVICDAEDRDVIWAFASMQRDHVHMAVVKRNFEELRGELLYALIGLKLKKPGRYTFVIPDILTEYGEMPRQWVFDPWAVGKEI
jgi:hypothetical protein